MPVKHVEEIERSNVDLGQGVTIQVLISSEESPNFAMRRFEIQPGGSMPNHTNLVEHEQYVLGGAAEIAIGEQIYQVQQGDVVFIPANTSHWYRNKGDAPFVFLCMVPNQPDTIKLVEE